jgi:squalene-hopene/tetraprenyl-beta-curcumene cyclase
VQPDGGIYRKGLSNYNTSICLVALLAERDPANDATLRRARRFVLGDQRHAPEGDPTDGGFAYDPGGTKADVSNTVYALEALHLSEGLRGAADAARDPQLDVKAAVAFLERCQHLPAYNHAPWVSSDAADRGGFIYDPGSSKAAAAPVPGELTPKPLRSYGTMTYAGLLSYIYADLRPEDPRVQAAHDWLLANYTLTENPHMGKQGLYYYYELMAKALSAYGAGELALADGRKVDWREDLATQLLSLQTKDGDWQNDNGRWWEKDPVLTTAYSLIALEFIYRRL